MKSFLKFIINFIKLIPKRIVELSKTGKDVASVAASGAGVFVNQKEFQRRLNTCRECDFLEDDGTCGVCTCYMTTKTKFKAAHCPHPDGSKW